MKMKSVYDDKSLVYKEDLGDGLFVEIHDHTILYLDDPYPGLYNAKYNWEIFHKTLKGVYEWGERHMYRKIETALRDARKTKDDMIQEALEERYKGYPNA